MRELIAWLIVTIIVALASSVITAGASLAASAATVAIAPDLGTAYLDTIYHEDRVREAYG